MRTNTAPPPASRNFEGTVAARLKPYDQLRRSVASCLLWEDTFYESGEEIAARIARLIKEIVASGKVGLVEGLAIEARNNMNLRHIPLFIARELVRNRCNVDELLPKIVNRPDELAEFLALYWKEGKTPVAASVKRGLAAAFNKFTAYSLAKYNNQDRAIKLRDVLFLVHPKPKDEAQAKAFEQLASNTLPIPGTWENRLSAGEDAQVVWTDLLKKRELGALALLRNLRNMQQAGVATSLIQGALQECNVEKVLPYRFIAAARYAPNLEPDLEKLMFQCVEGTQKLKGQTALIIDTSPSMWQDKVSAKSEMLRFDAAAALAILCREVCDQVRVYYFNQVAGEVPARRGFALRDALAATQGGWSVGNAAVAQANKDGYDRIIVLTDGEWQASAASSFGTPASQCILPPLTDKAYLINVAPQTRAVGSGKWDMVEGWSDSIVQYIQAIEGFTKVG